MSLGIASLRAPVSGPEQRVKPKGGGDGIAGMAGKRAVGDVDQPGHHRRFTNHGICALFHAKPRLCRLYYADVDIDLRPWQVRSGLRNMRRDGPGTSSSPD